MAKLTMTVKSDDSPALDVSVESELPTQADLLKMTPEALEATERAVTAARFAMRDAHFQANAKLDVVVEQIKAAQTVVGMSESQRAAVQNALGIGVADGLAAEPAATV